MGGGYGSGARNFGIGGAHGDEAQNGANGMRGGYSSELGGGNNGIEEGYEVGVGNGRKSQMLSTIIDNFKFNPYVP